MITPAQRAEIRRLYYGEHWKIGTIAAQLGLHRETVRTAVEHESGGVRRGVCRPSALEPYLPFIRDTLARYPRLRATRIHEMVRQRGYPGSVIQVRRLVKRLRPETTRAVYRRVVTLAGESAQVDWGSFGKVRIGHGTRAVSGFVMVLGYSRALAALFTLDQTLESFLRGHVDAFEALGRCSPAPPASASSTSRPSWPAIPAAMTPDRPSRTPRIWKGCSPPPAKPTSTPPATGSAPPSPPPPPSSSGLRSAARRYDRMPPGCSLCSTTTDRRSWLPPSTTPSNGTPSVPARSPTSSKRAGDSADSNRRSASRYPTDPDCARPRRPVP